MLAIRANDVAMARVCSVLCACRTLWTHGCPIQRCVATGERYAHDLLHLHPFIQSMCPPAFMPPSSARTPMPQVVPYLLPVHSKQMTLSSNRVLPHLTLATSTSLYSRLLPPRISFGFILDHQATIPRTTRQRMNTSMHASDSEMNVETLCPWMTWSSMAQYQLPQWIVSSQSTSTLHSPAN